MKLAFACAVFMVLGCGRAAPAGEGPDAPGAADAPASHDPDPSLSTVTVDPATDVIADGTDHSTVTVKVVDSSGTPIAGASVVLAATGTGNVLPQPGVTGTNGVTSVTFASTMAETKTVSATVGGTQLAQTPTVTFVPIPDSWPTCDSQPASAPTKTLSEIWTDNPATPEEAWVAGAYVTAVSAGGCAANTSCQIFVQSAESYASVADATHQSLRIGIAPGVAHYFTGIAVGDQVNVYARAFRDTTNGHNELEFLVSAGLPGCAKKVGTGTPTPLDVTLDALTIDAYENTVGPVLVRVTAVSGRPAMPAETFGLWDTATGPAGTIDTITSLSPYFLPGAAFTGLTNGTITKFTQVVGVFGEFVPPATPVMKYEEIYVRADAEYPIAP